MSHPERAQRRTELAADVKGGMDPVKAAEKHGVSAAWAYEACKEHGVVLPGWHKAGVVEVVAALLEPPHQPQQTLQSIADKCCLSKQRVHQILAQCRRYGLVGEVWPNEHSISSEEVGTIGRYGGAQA